MFLVTFFQMSCIRLVTFDVTNTMIRVLGGVGQNYANVAAQYGRRVDPAKIDVVFRKRFKQQMSQYPNFGVNSGLTPFKWWTSLVVDSFKEAGYDGPSLTQIANHLYIHFASSKGWEIIPGTTETLETLKSKGIKLGIISNFDTRLDKILHELSLAHYFEFIIDSASFGKAKPNPEIFDLALKLGKAKANESMHIGDSVTNDYEGATKAGMKAILLVDEDKPAPDEVDPAHIVRTIGEIEKFIIVT